MLDRKYIFIIVSLIITIFISGKFYVPDFKKSTFIIHEFPEVIDHWTSRDLPIERADKSVLENTNTALYRYYTNNGRRVYLYIVYSKTNPKVTNPPEICYKYAGISILDKGKKRIKMGNSNNGFRVNWLISDNRQNQRISYYFYKVGGIYTTSYWKQQGMVALNNLIGKPSGSALIRISVDIHDGQQEAIRLINDFTAVLIPQLSNNLP
jgi:EpsI family protein